jgi:hypothetical protein
MTLIQASLLFTYRASRAESAMMTAPQTLDPAVIVFIFSPNTQKIAYLKSGFGFLG